MARTTKLASKLTFGSLRNRRALASGLARLGRELHSRGWALGTSGNYSALLTREPLHLLITASGLDKSTLTESGFLQIDAENNILAGRGKPSAEAALHLAVARVRPTAGCILHTHSVWNTLLSEQRAKDGGLAISGYEMLKGLEGVPSHQYREWVPVLENDQDMPALAQKVEAELERDAAAHGFLICGHGLYTWGEDLAQARRHVEIFEFLFEVVGRREFGSAPAASR